MTNHSTVPSPAATNALFSGERWFDPIEAGVRSRVRGFLEAMIEAELDAALSRKRYERREPAEQSQETAVVGCRHGHRKRTLTGTFGAVEIAVPRARPRKQDGGSAEWKSSALARYQRRTRDIDALIASAYLAGTNTRRVKRVLGAHFKGVVGKDVVSRVWRKLKTDWEAWMKRDLSQEPIVRLILDGTVVRARLDRKSTSISLLVAHGVRMSARTGSGPTDRRCCFR